MKKLVLFFNILMLSIGNCGGPLISRLYFIHGGKRIWIPSMLQTVGCPIILIPLAISYFQRRKIEGSDAKLFFMTRQEFIGSAGVGILAGLDGYLNSWGPAKLPVSTSTLINATQLAFTALFAVLLVKQKLTAYSTNSIVLLIAGAATLALRANGDRPAGESAKDYMLGFIMTLIGAVFYGLMLPLIELIYMKAKQAVTYTTVLEIQMIIGISATIFCTIGMIINKDFQKVISTNHQASKYLTKTGTDKLQDPFHGMQIHFDLERSLKNVAIPREASQYEIGEAKYYMVLIWCAIIWQLALLGLVGVIFYSSSLLSGIIGAFLLPVTEVLAVILFREKFQAEKGVAIFLALWGFVSYFYGEHEQSKKEKQMKEKQNENQISQQLNVDQTAHVV